MLYEVITDSLPKLARWTINPNARKVSEDTVDERPQEFPRCHPQLNSKPYRFGYSLAVAGKSFPSIVITSYSIHYTKLYEILPELAINSRYAWNCPRRFFGVFAAMNTPELMENMISPRVQTRVETKSAA